ncbi:MAG: DUF2169 domain-containing protein [Pseudomonadota bacterium]
MVARAAFRLQPNEPLTPVKPLDQGHLTADTYAKDDEEREGECLYPGDFADFKPGADLLLRGTCHVPGGKTAKACRVTFKVGDWSKTLAIVGDRQWLPEIVGTPATSPKPFVSMPIGYAQSFGGDGYAGNPVGKGHSGVSLPNVVYPHLSRPAPGEDVAPAGFGPINPKWSPRAGKVGTKYGENYRQKRAPYYASDFDWRWFNAAPSDQQLAGYLNGDEELAFENMHPAAPALNARLPGLRLRAFASDAQGARREIPMQLDTLFADLDEGLVWLTWRGLDAVATDDLSDITSLLFAEEKLEEPETPADEYLAQLAAFDADPLGLDELDVEVPPFLRDAMAAEQARRNGEPPPAPSPDSVRVGTDPVSALLANELGSMAPDAQAKVKALIADQTEKLARSDIDLHELLADALARQKQAPPPIAPMAPGQKPAVKLAPAMRAMLEIAERNKDIVREKGREAQLKEVYRLARDPVIQELDPSYDPKATLAAAKKDAAKKPTPPDDVYIPGITPREAIEKSKQARASAARKASVSFPAQGKAPAQDASREDVTRVAPLRRQGTGDDTTRIAPARGPAAADGTTRIAPATRGLPENLVRANLRGWDLRREEFAGRDMRGSQLIGANLADVDLSGANLGGADMRETNLCGANLSGARLAETDLRRAKLDRASLYEARVDCTNFAGASLNATNATRLRGEHALFNGATLEQAVFSEAQLTEASFADVNAQLSLFQKATLKGSDFSGARLFLCDFEDAILEDVVFENTHLDTVSFMLGELTRTRFSGAELVKCGFRLARLSSTAFGGATGSLNAFDKCSLDGTDFRKAAFADTNFIEADANGAHFEQADLPRARFYKASLRECNFKRANLLSVDLCKSRMERSNFSAANLYDGKLLGASGFECRFDSANMNRVRR